MQSNCFCCIQVYSTAEPQSWHKNLANFATNSMGNAPQNSSFIRSISELQVITWRETRIDYATCTAVLSSYILLYKGQERRRRRSNTLHLLLDSITPNSQMNNSTKKREFGWSCRTTCVVHRGFCRTDPGGPAGRFISAGLQCTETTWRRPWASPEFSWEYRTVY
jgi:hypothetical protein